MSLKQDLFINPLKLDEAWAELPSLYHNYMEEKEQLDSAIKRKKQVLLSTQANLQKSIRIDPGQYGIVGKPLEKHISSLIDCDDFVIKTNKEILDLEKEKRLFDAAIKSLEMKKDALKALSSLYLAQYYIIPDKAGAENFITKQEMASNKESRQDVKKSLKRRSKKEK